MATPLIPASSPPTSHRKPAAAKSRRRSLLWLTGVLGVTILVAGSVLVWKRHWLDPEHLWDQAQAFLRAGKVDQAESSLVWIRRLRPPTVSDLMLEAQVAIARGDVDKALGFLAKVPPKDPLFSEACLLAGRLERKRKRVRVAEGHFLQALKASPTLIGAHKELIYLYGVQLRRREVDAEFRALSKSTHLTHHDLFTWAQTHFSQWSPDIAIDLQSYVDADPDDRHSRLALIELLVDQPGQSSRVSQLLSSFPPQDADALALRIAQALFENRLDDAESFLSQGPGDHPTIARYRGRLALIRRDLGSAVIAFRQALSAEPYDRVSTFELGQALALKGDSANADIYLTRARRLNEVYNLVNQVRSPDHENRALDLFRLANAFEAAGLLDEARHWYTLALARDPLNPEAQRALYRLQSASR